MGYQIREACLEDSPGIARVQVDSYRSAYAGLLPADFLAQFSYAEQEQDWRDWPAAHPDDILLVAVNEEGEIAGYALARSGLSEIPPYDSELLALHVRRADQRHGLGRRLVAAAAQRLQDLGCKSLMLWMLEQNAARSFYERLGGQEIGARPLDLGEGDVSAREVAFGWPEINCLIEDESQ